MMATVWLKSGFILSFLVLISLFPIESESAVSSIDLGSEWMKVAVVNLKPGHIPISIAINEMSKRKSPALVAFTNGDRLIGEEASGIIARYPDKVYSQVRDMIGKPFSYVKNLVDSLYLPFDVVEDSRGSVGIKTDDGTVYSPEEFVAMILSYGMSLSELQTKLKVKDVVISVPPFFGQAERRGLLQAAQLANINVLALINEHSGAALQYGIDKDFSNQSRHVVFYDMGSSTTYATLVYFSAYNTKEFGKTVSVNQFQVKDVSWNTDLGGRNMEMRLVEYFADEFNNQVGGGFDVRKFPKAMAKLKKQVKRTKEILSANTMAPISVESLHDDRDFRSSITREKFEELCGDLWEKSLTPLKEVIKNSGLKIDDIYAVELIGGNTRVPKLQAKLQEYLGRSDLDKHLDADEAIVLGSALHAANLSDGIKLNRKLGMIDGSSYGFTMELHGIEGDSTKELLVQRMKKLPIKLFRSIKHNKDFEVSLSYESGGALPPGVSSDKFAHYTVSGLADASEKYSSRNLSAPIKANLHFSLSRSGILSLDRADATVEISEWVDVPKKNLTVENSTTVIPNTSTNAGSTSSAEDSKTVGNLDSGSNETSSSNGEEKIETEKKLKKRTFRVPLKIIEKPLGPGMLLSDESLSQAKSRLEALDKKDAERRRTAELKNNLESFVYTAREKLDSAKDIEKISTKEERQSLIEKLEEVQEWLYTDGEDASAAEFTERLGLLKAKYDPIFFRLSELTERPTASEHARIYLTELQQIVSDWEKNKSWLPKEKIDEVRSEAEKFKKWLADKETEQKKTSLFSTPAFSSEDVYDKVFSLRDKVATLNKIPKPKPKVEKPPKNETESTNEKPKTENSSSEENSSKDEPTASSNDDEQPRDPHDEL
ncbi:hypothetical protein MKW98_008494 [Papaver atlanticum]|uniref:Heat shock 70 kDa protein 17 n=1 Tax=Papaver atlanticum TaxID=357466 RepID=A0AAD4X6Z5_9MAGN|nr:hypothetical protein MKW98_008494 [Papaver atlanticum]